LLHLLLDNPNVCIMNIRQLRYFLQIAELRSFTRASQVLHVAQPALSRQIHMLEEELGKPLFKRVGNAIALTETGQALRDRATALIYQFDQLRDEVISPQEPHGHLTVGVPPAMREMITLTLVDTYCRRYPNVSLHIHEGISVDLSNMVQASKLDCAIVVDLDDLPSARREALLKEQLFLVGPRHEGMCVDKVVSMEFAASKPLILTNRLNNFRLALENAFARENLPLKIVADSNSTSMIVDLVIKGLAFSMLPYCAIASGLRLRKLCAAPIKGLCVNWAIIYPASADPSSATTMFTNVLIEITRDSIVSGKWTSATLLTKRSPESAS